MVQSNDAASSLYNGTANIIKGIINTAPVTLQSNESDDHPAANCTSYGIEMMTFNRRPNINRRRTKREALLNGTLLVHNAHTTSGKNNANSAKDPADITTN